MREPGKCYNHSKEHLESRGVYRPRDKFIHSGKRAFSTEAEKGSVSAGHSSSACLLTRGARCYRLRNREPERGRREARAPQSPALGRCLPNVPRLPLKALVTGKTSPLGFPETKAVLLRSGVLWPRMATVPSLGRVPFVG